MRPFWAALVLANFVSGCGFDLIGELDDADASSGSSTGGSSTSTTGPVSTTVEAGSEESSSTGAPSAAGDCCEGHGGPACDDEAIAQCVCEQDPFCCDQLWDEFCADAVDFLGCGVCDPIDTGGRGSCCEAKPEPGCEQPDVEACVCGYDPFCCEYEWDGACVSLVDLGMCGSCQSTGDCCVDNGSPGCDDPVVEACVCAVDPFCCEGAWDSTCVTTARESGCAECMTDGGPCCEAHFGTGCDDPAIEKCVCAADYFCCGGGWDEACVHNVEAFGCGVCTGGPTDEGTGSGSGFSESSSTSGGSTSTGTSAGT